MLELPAHSRRIVVVEDNPADAKLFQMALEKAGLRLEIQVITDGMQAWSYFEKAAVSNRGIDCDLVLLDLNVPIMNGFEILERIKSHCNLKKLPVIILSSSSTHEDIERCYQAGANCYLTKPASLTEYFEMIARMADYWLCSAKLPAKSSLARIPSRA